MLKPTLLISILLLSAALAPAQTPLPARQVSANTNGWESLAPAAATAQSAFDWIDANWRPALVPGTNVLISSAGWQALLNSYGDITSAIPTNATAQSALDSADEWVKGLFDALEAIPAFEPDTFYFARDTNLTSASNWVVLRTNWAGSGVSSNLWPANVSGTDDMVLFGHPPFVVQDDILFPSFVTKEEFYAILNSMGFANVFGFTYSTSNEYYGAVYRQPANEDVQTWTVPADLNPGQEIGVYCWGGGGNSQAPHYLSASPGGFSVGTLVVHATNDTVLTNGAGVVTTNLAFDSSDASHVTNGMVMCVHVGYEGGRAAVWRYDGTNFADYLSPLIVAGGAGASAVGGYNGFYGGAGGGTNGLDGLTYTGGGTFAGGKGGTQIAGGIKGDGVGAVAGTDVWGGRAVSNIVNGLDFGGDGYFGGGSGGIGNWNGERYTQQYAGGGGSGFVHPDLAGYTTNSPAGTFVPPGITNVAWGLNAGYPESPGRVAFEILFDTWGE